MKIVAGSSSPMLARNIARVVNAEMADVSIKRFPDGECYVRFNEKVEHAIVVQNTYPDENLVELFLLQDALKRMNAQVDVVIPYYGYGRQDKIFEEGEAVSAAKMAKLIEMDADSIILINPHKRHILNFFNVKAEICDGVPAIAEYFKGKVDAVVAPDKGAVHMAEEAASVIGCGYDYFEKTRISGSEVRMEIKSMEVENKRILILDDIISTGGTMAKAVELLKKQGAEKIYAACIHGLFIGNADERIIEAGCDELIASDTIESAYSKISVAEEVASLLES